MSLLEIVNGSTMVPNLVLILLFVAALLLLLWTVSLARDRNPLPFPDRDYHVFSASSSGGLIVLEDLMRKHGHSPRFRVDTDQVERTIFTNGTIVNYPRADLAELLGRPSAALGFVVRDPDLAAVDAAQFLQSHGFDATVIRDAEPGLPITFVRTNALSGAALVFRKHVLRMGRKPPAWTPRKT